MTTITDKTLTFCVEIGGTRIKGGFLEDDLSYEKLQQVKTFAVKRQVDDQERIQHLFKKNALDNPLLAYLENATYSKIAVSVTGPVFDEEHIVPGNIVPTIYRALSDRDPPVRIISRQNDVACWATGALAYQKMKAVPVTFPYLAVTIGTGIGIGLCQGETSIMTVEINYFFNECPFQKLKELSLREQPFPYWSVHKALGAEYFKWRFANKPFQDEEMAPFLQEYNERFQIFLEELHEFLKKTFKTIPSCTMIGGGFSRFIRIPENFLHKTVLLTPRTLESDNVSPDVIQLLGAKILLDTGIKPTTYPPYEELMKRREELLRIRGQKV